VLAVGSNLHPKIEFIEAALPELPFHDDEFDLIVASEVLYYLTPTAQNEAIKSLTRVLKPRGYLLIGSALGGSYFSVDSARNLMRQHFECIAEDTINMAYYHKIVSPLFYSIRLNSLLMNDASPGSQEMRRAYLRWKPLLSSIPIRQLVWLIAKLGEPIISNRFLPSALNALGCMSVPTNIALLGRKIQV
jgi:SAM-dependent methyltransferase